MVKPAPDIFNPDLVARQSEKLSVAFPLAQCKRLVEFLATDSGQLKGGFSVVRHGRQLVIAGHFATEFTLECQRCLHEFVHPIAADFKFVLVPDQEAAEALPEQQDPLIVGEDGMLNVIDIFEDELILQLPTVPRHLAVEDCTFDVTVDIQPSEELTGGADENATGTDTPAASMSAKPGFQKGSDVFAELKNLRFDKD